MDKKVLFNKLVMMGAGCVVIGAYMSGWGIIETLNQHQKASTYQPVVAVITVSEAIEQKALKRTYFGVKIEFEYQVDGHIYTANETNAEVSGRFETAEFAEKYPVGMKTTAFYNPDKPSEAMLLRRYSSTPYCAILFGFLTVEFAFWWTRQEIRKRTLPKPLEQEADGWYRLPLNSHLIFSIFKTLSRGMVWLGLIIFCRADYLSVSQESPGWEMLVLTIIYYSVGVICVLLGLMAICARLNFLDPVISLSQPSFELGDQMRIRVRQPVCKNGVIEQIKLTLKCTTTEVIGGKLEDNSAKEKEHVEYEQEYVALENYQSKAGETLEHEFEIEIPLEHPPTITALENSSRFTKWTLHYDAMKTFPALYSDHFVLHFKERAGWSRKSQNEFLSES